MVDSMNDEPTAVNGGPSTNHVSEGDTMQLNTQTTVVQARVSRLTYSAGVTRGEITCTSGDAVWCIPVSISGLPQRAGAARVQALAKIEAGAVVLDGHELNILRADMVKRIAAVAS